MRYSYITAMKEMNRKLREVSNKINHKKSTTEAAGLEENQLFLELPRKNQQDVMDFDRQMEVDEDKKKLFVRTKIY